MESLSWHPSPHTNITIPIHGNGVGQGSLHANQSEFDSPQPLFRKLGLYRWRVRGMRSYQIRRFTRVLLVGGLEGWQNGQSGMKQEVERSSRNR